MSTRDDDTSGANLLGRESSRYLRLHANDPVQWHPWGEEAILRAKRLERPIFLSIGYASCHWCHVMARESFSDPKVAALLNEKFVSVKVDREERPDVDAVYMAAVQALTGSGGWPLTVVLTPDLQPFFGGTYYPPNDRLGLPSFTRVLNAVAAAWEGRRREVEDAAEDLAAALARLEEPPGSPAQHLAQQTLAAARETLLQAEDKQHGGFRGAPKFPPHEVIRLLLEGDTSEQGEEGAGMALRTLDAVAKSGLTDQLGGGFARYAVDEAWRVPHFEMMLPDNAAMLRNYALAYARTKRAAYRRTAYGVAAWLLRELAFAPGEETGAPLELNARIPREVGFHSSLNAEQGGVEGAYYTFTENEARAALGEEFELGAARYGITTPGPLEGRSVLRQAASVTDLARAFGAPESEIEERLERIDERLKAAREKRPRPDVDDKALASWNGLTVHAFAVAARAFGDPRLLQVARATLTFIKERLYHRGELWHSWRLGERRVTGLLEDHAYVGLGALELYRQTLDNQQLELALELANTVQRNYADPRGGYYSSAATGDPLPVRPKGYVDASTMSENAAAAELTWWAGRYEDDPSKTSAAQAALAGLNDTILRAPNAFASSLRALTLMEAPPREVVLSGEADDERLAALTQVWRDAPDAPPIRSTLLLLVDGHARAARLPLAQERTPATLGAPAAFVCEAGACRLPARTPSEFRERLEEVGLTP